MTNTGFPAALPARLLVVDDEATNLRVLTQALRLAGYGDICSTDDSREVIGLVETYKPDLILLDLHMPHLDGFAVMRLLGGRLSPSGHLPVLVLTADTTNESRWRALSCGASDFLTKPFDVVEVALRVRNLLQVHFLTRDLEAEVALRTMDLEATRMELVERLALAAEYRDDDTGQHAQRVGRSASQIAASLGWSSGAVETIRHAAPLHDIGKIGVPDALLMKPGRLTPEEFAVMRTHAAIGGRILSGARFPVLRMAEEIAMTHHERWDGTGYPAGLIGEAIPVAGRIVAVADVYDALTHARQYKAAWTAADAVMEIRSQSGRQFDPAVVTAFLTCLPFDPDSPATSAVAQAASSRYSTPLATVSTAISFDQRRLGDEAGAEGEKQRRASCAGLA